MDINSEYLTAYVDKETLYDHCQWVTDSITKFWSHLSIPRSVILNDVFPFTVLTETPFVNPQDVEKFQIFARKCFTKNCPLPATIACAVKQLNAGLYDFTSPPIVFEPAPPNVLNSYSIEDLLEKKSGSCTSMSVFLITGLRSIGVPARIAGVPHWNLSPGRCPDGDASPSCGNHNWVEVYDPKGWSFVDQRRPDLQVFPLNHSWFFPDFIAGNTHPGRGNHSVYAASFMPVNALAPDYPSGRGVVKADHFPMVWDWNKTQVSAWDVSAAYLSADLPRIQIE